MEVGGRAVLAGLAGLAPAVEAPEMELLEDPAGLVVAMAAWGEEMAGLRCQGVRLLVRAPRRRCRPARAKSPEREQSLELWC